VNCRYVALPFAAFLLAATGAALAQTASEGPPAVQEQTAPPSSEAAATDVKGEEEALARQLSNPVASLISVPFQLNWDHRLGPEDEGRRFLLNFQPVVPFALNDDWNLIARLIVPVLAQPVLFEGGDPAFGVGDMTLSFFLSPSRGAITWGVGPAFVLPVTSDPVLGGGKYAIGPTAVVLKQAGSWTVGALVNHVWSVGGDAHRADISQTFMQPFIAFGAAGWTLSANSEALANWKAPEGERWTVPINFAVSKVLRLGARPMSIGAGPRFYVDAPEGGPSWGFRLTMALLFPAGG